MAVQFSTEIYIQTGFGLTLPQQNVRTIIMATARYAYSINSLAFSSDLVMGLPGVVGVAPGKGRQFYSVKKLGYIIMRMWIHWTGGNPTRPEGELKFAII